MNVHIRTALIALVLSFFAYHVKAGCNYLFQFHLVNEQGEVVDYVQPGSLFPAGGPLLIELQPGLSLRASLGFTSCCGGQSTLHRDGVLVEEWIGAFGAGGALWETAEPGNYSWWVEGYCNMAIPVTAQIVIQQSSATYIDDLTNDLAFQIGQVMFEGNVPYFDCKINQNTTLQIEVLTANGKLIQTFIRVIPVGQSRIPIEIPLQAQAMLLFRFTSSEGKVAVRKGIL
jgi:hypothetical protein